MTSTFLGLNFKPLTLEDQPLLEDFLKRYPSRLSGYTFASLMSWNEVDNYMWTFFGPDTLLISMVMEKKGKRHLVQPEGPFSKECEAALLKEIAKLDYPIKLIGISPQFLRKHASFCSRFEDLDDISQANYVYRASDLALLEGRRYSKKRNLIAQADQLYRWSVRPLTDDDKDFCRAILATIEDEPHPPSSRDLERELMVLGYLLDHFSDLKQRGCVIDIDGRPVAFSVYEELTPRIAVVHFEKAEKRYKGLYQLINRETAKAILSDGFELINREEDLGKEGLRQAKMSYCPVGFAHFHILTYKL